mmetsp:Transcript_56117/g.60744  ORF Transcript_56117/g.60744 Transcript_56117/m.60744 type:complete len:294 (+) Transcript_56117:60-941(+)
MVVIEDFEFELVSADEDSKIKFQEHKKNSKTYAEVEPDAEYYLSVRKVRPSSTILCCEYFVDGKSLGYKTTFQAHTIDTSPQLNGVLSELNGIQTVKALKFMKASFTSRNNSDDSTGGYEGSSQAGMGDIKMKVYEGIPLGYQKQKDWNTSFTASSIDMDMATKDAAAVTMKKNLRTGEGSNVIKSEVNTVRMRHEKGTHLYTVTVHYCAAPGLIAVGVLPKPHHWTYARMLHPAQTTAKEKEQIEKGVTKNEENGKEILELKDDSDSDSDDDDDELKKTGEKEKKRAKRVDI